MIMTTTRTSRTGVVKLWLLNILANAVLVAVWYFWLLIPDAHIWQVAGSGVIAVVGIALLLWLRAGTLAWLRVSDFRANKGIWRAYRLSLRHVPALGLWALVFVVFAWRMWSLHDYIPQFAVWLRQKLGNGPPPRNIMRDLNWLLLAVVGFVLPGLWVPFATTIAAVGFQAEHIVLTRQVWKRPLYWLWFCLLLGFGLYVPYKLTWWIPDLQTLRQQAWSMAGRFLLAYLVAVTLLLTLAWMTAVHTDHEDPIVP